MIIRELVLHNFGVYASTNKFEFQGKKPIVLIGGMNGRGKTTFLEAVLLALYGSNSFAYSESKYKTFGQYLKSFINVSDGTLETFIDLEFSIDSSRSEIYRIHREWSGDKKRIAEHISVYKDQEYNQFLTDNWMMFIENILPSGLSNFFFFDGEKIAELAVEETSNQMKESIKSLDAKFSVKGRQDEMVDLQSKLDQIDSYLSVDIDEKVIAKIYKKIKVIEQKLIKLDVQITEKTDERRAANGELLSATSAFNKRVEGYLKRVELNDDSDRIVKYSHMANTIIDEYKIRLQKSKISIVADTMTLCYKKLANKKNLIDRIEMDPVTLDLKYLNVEGDEVNKASLSAGEKQLMVISLLWSLALCSKKKLPVIIDTPLSRLDSVHRVSLIKTYFPQASEQTIILSTDSEIDKNYYKIMKDNIGDQFTLVYNDLTKSTTIKKGYFLEANE